MSEFGDKFILSRNIRLSQKDLEMLDKISEEYTPWELGEKILSDDIESIVSYLILGRLPFSLGQKLITTNGRLFSKLAVFDGEHFLPNCPGYQTPYPYVQNEIDKINRILYEC